MDKLTFLGSQYSRAPQAMPAIADEVPGKFMGAPSKIRRYAAKRIASGKLVALTFLGRSYQRYVR
ncbi:MAG: hypothetical protein AAFN18_13790 [Cyanobacteria bacterium J06554_6]